MYKLSPSSINLMLECPRCFWLKLNGIWKRPNGIFPSLPSGMDRIIKSHFDNFREIAELPPELKDKLNSEFKLFCQLEQLHVWRDNFNGIRWKDRYGNILHGAVDDILVKNNKLIVLDYKTKGTYLKNNIPGFYQNQLDIYTFLLNQNGYPTEDYAFLLFYSPKTISEDGRIIFDTCLEKVCINVDNAFLLFQKALKLLGEECPTNTCSWCENVKDGKKERPSNVIERT